jgi:hypothetical protein
MHCKLINPKSGVDLQIQANGQTQVSKSEQPNGRSWPGFRASINQTFRKPFTKNKLILLGF